MLILSSTYFKFLATFLFSLLSSWKGSIWFPVNCKDRHTAEWLSRVHQHHRVDWQEKLSLHWKLQLNWKIASQRSRDFQFESQPSSETSLLSRWATTDRLWGWPRKTSRKFQTILAVSWNSVDICFFCSLWQSFVVGTKGFRIEPCGCALIVWEFGMFGG